MMAEVVMPSVVSLAGCAGVAAALVAVSDSVAVTFWLWPLRWMSRSTFDPGAIELTRLRRSFESLIGWPFTCRMTSPVSMPAREAGLSGETSATIAPCTDESPRLFAMSELMGCAVTPSSPRCT